MGYVLVYEIAGSALGCCVLRDVTWGEAIRWVEVVRRQLDAAGVSASVRLYDHEFQNILYSRSTNK